LRVLPLGFSFCLVVGLFTVVFGIASVLLHFTVSAEPKTACTVCSPLPQLHRDWGSPLPHLHRD
jgi:hypothetical protein